MHFLVVAAAGDGLIRKMTPGQICDPISALRLRSLRVEKSAWKSVGGGCVFHFLLRITMRAHGMIGQNARVLDCISFSPDGTCGGKPYFVPINGSVVTVCTRTC